MNTDLTDTELLLLAEELINSCPFEHSWSTGYTCYDCGAQSPRDIKHYDGCDLVRFRTAMEARSKKLRAAAIARIADDMSFGQEAGRCGECERPWAHGAEFGCHTCIRRETVLSQLPGPYKS